MTMPNWMREANEQMKREVLGTDEKPGAIRCLNCGRVYLEAPEGWSCTECGHMVSQHMGTIHVGSQPNGYGASTTQQRCARCGLLEESAIHTFFHSIDPDLSTGAHEFVQAAPANAAGGQHSNVPLTNSVKRIYRELEALSDEEVTNSMCEHMPWPRVDSFGEPAGDAETAEMVRGVFESLLHKLHHRIADSQPAAFESGGQK